MALFVRTALQISALSAISPLFMALTFISASAPLEITQDHVTCGCKYRRLELKVASEGSIVGHDGAVL